VRNRDYYINDAQSAREVVKLAEELGGEAVALRGDVAIEADVFAIFHEAEKCLGKLDGIVINAGIVAPSMPLADMTADKLKRMFEVNVLGAYLCARQAARVLPGRERGRYRACVVSGRATWIAIRVC
jgi:NAD(P)-dependent dehydrogenase (short-subunit alcohol dehydrogenase family)